MALPDLSPIELAFREAAGDRPSSLIPHILSRSGPILHNEQKKPRQFDVPTCSPNDTPCLCSLAASLTVELAIYACSLTRGGDTAGPTTRQRVAPTHPATSTASLPTSSNTLSPATPGPPAQPSSPNPTTTAPSSFDSSAVSTPSASVDRSNSNKTPSLSEGLFSSAVTTENDSTSLSSISSPTIPIMSGSSSTPSPLSPGAVSSVSPPPSSGPHRLNTGVIVGIVLGALAALLASALALFLLRRRARRSGRSKSKHTSVESSESRQRLGACSYSDGTSRPASSVLTLGSALTPGGPDYSYEPKREPRAHSSALSETRSLAGDASVHSLHDGLLGAPAPIGPEVPSASSELLALANALNLNDGGGGGGLRRSGSGRSRTTASSGEVQSVEAL